MIFYYNNRKVTNTPADDNSYNSGAQTRALNDTRAALKINIHSKFW